MSTSAKRRALFLLLFTAFITMLLAATLPGLELQKGVPLPGATSTGGDIPSAESAPLISININTFALIVISLILILSLIYFATKIRVKPDWKEIARAFLIIVMISLALTIILFAFAQVRVSVVPQAMEILPTQVKEVGPDLAPVPAGLLWLVWICLAITALLLVIALLRLRSPESADPLVFEAEQAVQALKAGQDLRSVIIHCYQQMSLIMQEEQGLAREETMTAREFEALLETRGVPHLPVNQLTRLFETARYAAQLPGPDAEQQALDSLNAIIQFSHKKEAAS